MWVFFQVFKTSVNYRKSLLFLLCYSVVCSRFFITAIQMANLYYSELQRLESESKEVIRTFQRSLASSIKDDNSPQIEAILEGVIKIEIFADIWVLNQHSHQQPIFYIDVNTQIVQNVIPLVNAYNTVELTVAENNNTQVVGTFNWNVNKAKVRQSLIDNVWFVLIAQFIKTLFVSLFMLFLFHRFITQRLYQVMVWLNGFEPKAPFKGLPTAKQHKDSDEMDTLVNTINIMGQHVHEHTVMLEDLVKARTEELEKLAYTDSLTGVSNRAAFFKQVDDEIHRADRLSYTLGMMMMDLDHFKSINDTYGHEASDKVLVRVAKALTHCIRQEDTLGRLGGEEFSIIVPNANSLGMKQLANRLLNAVSSIDLSFLEAGKQITVSIGYTRLLAEESFKVALNRADEHLYVAKTNGRNRFVTDDDFAPENKS